MEKDKLVKFWLETAEKDYNTMLHLYESKDYHWSLFMGHLVIEKLLKALYVKNIGPDVPRTHDLLRIAEKIGISLTEQTKDYFDLLTTFNITARYPDYKQTFYKKCTPEFTASIINVVKELREWILMLIEK
ncbi:MAG: HEPN domain-containing protein [Caldanaerobacter subterraneus]|nr:HEPN domain-containing protein [Caldanaerobacter subterraneus]